MSADVVRQAIVALSDGAQVRAAEEYISKFERTREAWEIASQILHESAGTADPHSFCFHAAKIIYIKIIKDFDQLQESDISNFTQTLVKHIIALAPTSHEDMKATRYVCLAIAALAIQINQKGVITALLQWLNPILTSSPNVILEFLTLLPEEGKNERIMVTGEILEAFEHQLTDSFQDVLTFLHSQWANAERLQKVKILKCMTSWIQFTHIRVQDLISHPLFSLALDCLSGQDMFEEAASVVSIAFVQLKKDEDLGALVTATVPRLAPLREFWTVLNADGEIKNSNNLHEFCYSISELFSLLAEATLQIMMVPSAPDFGQMEIIAQLLECANFPYYNKVSEYPLTFFFQLGQFLEQKIDDVTTDPHAAHLVQTYSPVFGTLLDITMKQCAISEELFQGMDSEDVLAGTLVVSDEELETRETWSETIIDCRVILGTVPCINHVCSALQVAIQTVSAADPVHADWASVESKLFVLKFLVSKVPPTEASVMPWLCDAIIRLPDLFGLKTSIIDLTGMCAIWMAENPTMLPHFLSLLSSTLQNEQFTLPSATAISNIFKTCKNVPDLPVVDFNNLVVAMRQRKLLAISSDNLILEGLCSIVSSQPAEQIGSSLQVIVGQLIEDLQDLISTAGEAHTQVLDHKAFGSSLDRLTTIFKSLNIPIVNYNAMFETVYPLLTHVLFLFPKNHNISERVCRVYKNVVRVANDDFKPFMPSMTSHLCTEFARNYHEAFIYIASVVISIFGKSIDPECNTLLTSMVQTITSTFFAHLSSLKAFSDNPCVVEEFFYMLAKVAKDAPAVLLQAQLEAGVYNAALVALQIEHREAHRGVLKFFDNFLENINVNKPEVPAEVSEVYRQMLCQFGANLVSALIVCLSGNLTIHILKGSRNVTNLLLCIRNICNTKISTTQFQEWFITGLTTLPIDSQKIAVDMHLETFIASREDECHIMMEKFFKKCVKA